MTIWRWFALLAVGLPAIAAADPSVSYRVDDRRPESPYIQLQTALYTAQLDPETRMCQQITMTIRREDVEQRHNVNRDWWTPEELAPYVLEDNDYNNGGYDRGHLRALAWSRGSPDWAAVNCTAVIVPELPNLNRGAIREFEEDVANIVRTTGWAQVVITMTYDEDFNALLPNADEDHQVPAELTYLVTYPGGQVERIFYNAVPLK